MSDFRRGLGEAVEAAFNREGKRFRLNVGQQANAGNTAAPK